MDTENIPLDAARIPVPGRVYYVLCKIVGWVAMLLLIALFVALIDGLWSEMRKGINHVDALPGSEIPLSGPISIKEAQRDDFLVEGNTPDGQVKIVLEDYFASYWFGSGMWRGKLFVGEHAESGDYPFVIHFKNAPPRSGQAYLVAVRSDEAAQRADSFSRIYRHMGINPFYAAMVLAPLGLVFMVGNFLLVRQWGKALAAVGCAEVYKTTRAKEGLLELTFSLGSRDGVAMRQSCLVCTPQGLPLLRANVALCQPRSASLLAPAASKAGTGCLVFPEGAVPKASRRDA